jgi:hypothetical protein
MNEFLLIASSKRQYKRRKIEKEDPIRMPGRKSPMRPKDKLASFITEKEIQMAISLTANSSAGPDGIRLAHLKKVPTHLLCKMLNLWMIHSSTPK